jgi:hypothetical protein
MRLRPAIGCAVLAAAGLLIHPSPCAAQLVLGQYEEEAPVRTWNSFALSTAAALGRGETSFTAGQDASAAVANPALLAGLPRFTLSVNGFLESAAFSKYGPVNTGVILSAGNIDLVMYSFDSAGVSVRVAGWTFALNVHASEIYDRPSVAVESVYNGILYGETQYGQTGILREWQFAVARMVFRRLSLGAAVGFVEGKLEREFIDTSYDPTTIITDRKEQTFRGFRATAGLLARFSDGFQAALVVRTPLRKSIRSASTLRYEAPAGGTDITIADEADDTAQIPASAGLGVRLAVLPELDAFAEATATFWSRYSVTFFGDPQPRDFKDTLKAGLGLEYRSRFLLGKHEAVLPLRIGGIYDPQPAGTPRAAYAGLTFGGGISWRSLGLDAGGLIGRESGSGANLKIAKFALSLRFVL